MRITSSEIVAKMLYALKLALMGEKIEQELRISAVFSGNQRPLLKRFLGFVLIC